MADKKNYLDKPGLSHLWSKIKDYISGATSARSKKLIPICAIGSDKASSAGWYKVADSTMSGYGNTTITYLVKSGYELAHVGILHLEMRSDNTKISCNVLKWLIRSGFSSSDAKIVIDGMKWTLYIYNGSNQYGRIMFTMLEHVSIGSNGGDPTFTVNHYNTSTPETSTPVATSTSSDGGRANVANTADLATKATQDSDGRQINTNYLRKSSDYLNTHPENSGTILPFMNNDIAFLIERGGSAKVYYDGVEQNISPANMFDASASYWANNPTGITEVVIELTLHKVFPWTNTIYVDHGAAGWRAKNVKIETINTNYADDVWVARYTNTAQGKGNYFTTFTHQAVGSTNGSSGFNKIRFTFSDWANSTIFRIAQLGVIMYGSAGLRETNMSRGIDDGVLRNITPYYDGKYNFGSATKRWLAGHFKNLVLYGTAANQPLMTRGIVGSDGNGAAGELHLQYGVNQPIKLGNAAAYSISADGGTYSGTAAKATKLTTARTINGVSFDGSANITLPNATTTDNGLMSNTDKTKLDGIATGATKNTASSTTPKAAGTAAIGTESNFARGDHVHPAQTEISGNSGSATKLKTARNINLSGDIEGTATFDGSQDITLNCKVISTNQEDGIETVVVTTTSEIADNTNYTIPIEYVVGNNSLEIYYMGEKLIKNTHYKEVGTVGEVSTTIMFYNWGISVPADRTIEFLVYSTNVGPLNIDAEELKEALSGGAPIGSGMDYFGSTAPKNYMFADGSAISRTEYSELFAIIGTTYGTGDGSTTFNLPDKRTRVSVMKDNGTFNTLGAKGGSETHTLTASEMPSHTHTQTAHSHTFTGTASSGSGTLTRGGQTVVANMSANGGSTYKYRLAGESGLSTYTDYYNMSVSITPKGTISDTTATNQNTGGGQAHSILQPYLVCNYIIKVK